MGVLSEKEALQNVTKMKDDIAFSKSKRLGHTRQHFNLMTALAEWSISDAGGRDAVFGTRPGTASYTPTDATTEARRAAEGNLANVDSIKALLEKIMPGWNANQEQAQKTTASMLRGEIPKDVQDQVRRSSAFKALSGGYGGSGMSKALTSRDFGLTSMDMMERGSNAAQRWSGMAQGSVAPWMVTGQQQTENTFRNNLYSQITEQMRLNTKAAPDPGAAGQFNLQNALGSMAASFGFSSALNAGGGQQQKQNQPQGSNTWNAYRDWGMSG